MTQPNPDQPRPADRCAFARNGTTTCRTSDHCATCDGWPTRDGQPHPSGHAQEQQ